MTTDATTIESAQSCKIVRSDTEGNRALGFWIYLMSDLVVFSVLFATYEVLGSSYAGGPTGKELFHLPYTFGETMFLLFSSATCGLAVSAMHDAKKDSTLIWLAVTFLLGLGFVGMEIHEFRQMILDGSGPDRSGFLSAFFALVGAHGAHVTVGLIWIAFMTVQIATKGFNNPVRFRLMRLSMFWHFLDIIWVGIFTFVYLMGVM